MSRVFAYCRVSTTGQTVENQVREIEAAGFNINARRIVTETVSGSTASAQACWLHEGLLTALSPRTCWW